MLEKLEMHDIQDKTRLLDEMNETREGVNKALEIVNGLVKRVFPKANKLERIVTELEAKVSKLMRTPEAKPKKAKKPDKAKSNVASDHGFQKA